MRTILSLLGLLGGLSAAMAACSSGSQPATLIPPGPSDPGGPTQDQLGSPTGSPVTTTFTNPGTGGQGTTTACAPDGMPCAVPADCCLGACTSSVCGSGACAALGSPCGATVTCCDIADVCETSICCIPAGGTCATSSDCCFSAPNCNAGQCGQ